MIGRLSGCDQILHLGDIGGQHVLDALSEVAPVHAVRGNVDEPDYLRRSRRSHLDPEWAASIPITLDLVFEDVHLHLIHDVAAIDPDVDADVIAVGHSHIPRIERHDGQMVVNPGSTGPRRFSLPISMAFLDIQGGVADVELVELSD